MFFKPDDQQLTYLLHEPTHLLEMSQAVIGVCQNTGLTVNHVRTTDSSRSVI